MEVILDHKASDVELVQVKLGLKCSNPEGLMAMM